MMKIVQGDITTLDIEEIFRCLTTPKISATT